MSGSREAACNALLAAMTAAYSWANIPTRRLKLLSDVPKENRPALFQSESGHEYYTWNNSIEPKRAETVRLFAYFTTDSELVIGASQLNAAKDAIDAALTPSGADLQEARQTLGGTAWNCRVKGIPLNDPGDIDGDGILIVEIELIFP